MRAALSGDTLLRSAAALLSVIVIFGLCLDEHRAQAFRLSFGHRLFKAIQPHSNPQLNPPDTLIRPIECRNANNHSEAGICMFSIDCMQNKGVPLSICKHNYFVGTCCKLPDYNNFVGIVYDLRETETASQQLEARRGASGQLEANSLQAAAHSKPIPVLNKLASLQVSSSPPPPPSPPSSSNVSELQSVGQSSTIAQQAAAAASGAPQSIAPEDFSSGSSSSTAATGATSTAPPPPPSSHLERRSTVNSDLYEVSTFITTTSGQTTPKPAGQLADKLQLDEKYVISSTKLFGSSPLASTLKPLDVNHQPSVVLFPTGNSIETARNADGQISAQTNNEIIQQLNNETSLQAIEQQQQQQQHVNALADAHQPTGGLYEVLSTTNKSEDLAAAAQLANGLDISQIVVGSAHSAPSTNRLSVQQQQQQQNSVYLLSDEQNQRTQPDAKRDAPTSIVFSSNHQAASGGEITRHHNQPPPPPSLSSLAPPTSDQEFTLSTSQEPVPSSSSSISSLILNSSSPASPPTSESPLISPSTTVSSNALSAQTIEQTNSNGESSSPVPLTANPTGSPYVDLISSAHHSTAQTTTPFTSSLSTAILPNISSHPYAPTTLAPAIHLSTASPTSSSTSSQQALVSQQQQQQPHSSTSSSPSSPPSSQQQEVGSSQSSSSSSTSAVPLFYSTSHQSSSTTTSTTTTTRANDDAGSHHGPAHSSRPGGGGAASLQAASKIVTGNSASNNLIPGLGGLQSAILAHIPFKIASGLSSGLTSYLQAAMKPSGATRPIISSNTAPALQYQQHHQQQHQQHHSNGSFAAHANKPSSSNSAPQQGAAVRFPTATSSPTSTVSPAPAPSSTVGERDVLHEAQLVCGKPQVSPHDAMKKRVARIVGGNQSSFGQWPWMVSLRQWRKGAFLHKCGAALLNENWAITAAHCVENVKAPDLLLRLGEFDVSNQNEPYPYTERRVKSVVSHPSFDPKTFEYDLALIKFTEPIQYERNIIPVCVPSGNDSYVDRMATVIGWGRLYEDGPLPDVIQHVDVPIITNQECEKMYKNAGFVEEIPEMFICAGISKGGRDSCEGDSGGPLTMVDHDGRSYLVGIISWGIGCALPSQPGVYTRITAFSPWINSILTT